VSPNLLASNSTTGIFGIFPKEERKFVTFKTGILGGPAAYKNDNKAKAA